MARPLRVEFEGALYHLVIRANNRQPLFRDKQDKRRYLELLSRYQGRFGFRIYCYLLISRQVHLLIETPRGNVSKVMQCLGTSYTSYFNRRHKRRGTLFEGRYRSFLVDKENYLPNATRYVHRVHFHLATSVRQKRGYPWSSYRIYLGRKMSELVEAEPVLSRFGRSLREQRRRYQEFVENEKLRGYGYPNRQNATPTMNVFGLANKVSSQHQNSQSHNREETSLRAAEKILREVSLSLNPSEVRDLRESRKRALARHVAMYLIRKQTTLPLRSIGALLGVKAPAVALGIGKVEQLLKREDFSKKVRSLLENKTLASSEEDGAPVQKELSDGSAVA